jgi:argininosuccinate synthase
MSERKIVLEYTGGMDTSVISKWLEVEQGYEVIAAYYNYGQEADLAELKKKALLSGAKKFCVIDLERDGSNLFSEEKIQRQLTQVARDEGAAYVAFTQTRAGLATNAIIAEIAPTLQVVEPFETCWVQTREDQVDFLKRHHVPVGIGQKEQELKNDFAAFCDWHKRRDVYGTTY